jgi:formylglycine-generating enzyme required for sulfatase activity
MGSRSNDQKRHGTPSQCKVEISKGFWLAKTAVTQALWHAVMGRNPSHFIGEVLPVENVSWNDACEFLKKSNEIDIVGWKMVLPTEAQWEFACRAGESMQSYGRTLNDIAWYDANSGGRPQPAGEKRPNERGLHDMRGNIWEWCADWYGANLPGGTDPRGALSGTSRVYRGGSWFSHAESCHAACRNAGVPSFRSNNLGFRPARVSSE